MNYIKGEKFKSLEEALFWCIEKKPVFNSNGMLDTRPLLLSVCTVIDYWEKWRKAIKAPEKKMKAFYLWMDPCDGRILPKFYSENGQSVKGDWLTQGFVRLDWSKTMIEVEGEE